MLDHVAHDGLRREFELAGPGGTGGEGLVGVLEFLGEGLRPGDVLDDRHALGVVHALGLEGGDLLTAGLLLLGLEEGAGVVENGLEGGDDVDGVGVGFAVEQRECREGEGGERLVEGEVALQLLGEVVGAALVVGTVLGLDHDARVDEALEQFQGVEDVAVLLRAGVVVGAQQVLEVLVAVAGAGDDVEQHRVGHAELRAHRLRLGDGEALVGLLRPGDLAVADGLQAQLLQLLRVGAGALTQAPVLDLVLRGLDDDGALRVVAGTPGAAGDLVELTRLEDALAGAVELRQPGHEHRADGHVDADAEGVGAADDLEQAGLGEALDEAAVLRQHARVVDADAATQQPRQGLAVGGGEAEVADLGDDPLLGLVVDDLQAGQRLRAFGGLALGEVDDVDRRLAVLQQVLDRLVHRRVHVGEVQRHGAFRTCDERGRAARAGGEVLLQEGRVTEGGGHEEELRLRQLQQRHLPRPAALRVGVVVELVHDDLVDASVRAVAKRDVGDDLRRRRDDGGLAVDGGVAGHHADVLGAEDLAQREELLAHQRLDGGGVEGALPAGHGDEVRRVGHHRLTRPGRCRQDDVVAGKDAQCRLLLRRVQLDPAPADPTEETVEDGLVEEGLRDVGQVRQHLGEVHTYSP